MLTKDLLEVRKRKPNITPRFRDPDETAETAQKVLESYEEGRTRNEIWNEVSDLETHDNFKFVRGLSKLIERDSEFEMKSPVDPTELRSALFEKGSERGFVTSEEERQEVVEEVASELGVGSREVNESFWSDREEYEVLVSTSDYEPAELVKQYNLSLSQTLLFDAVELDFRVSGNYQQIFRTVKYLGLMYKVDDELKVNVTGPASLFRKTRKYGTSLAKLLPAITRAEKWWINAKVETEVRDEKRIYDFVLDSEKDHLFPQTGYDQDFDSEVERSFASRIESLIEGWEVKREPTILRAGNRVMIPDFSFKRSHGNEQDEFYLEVVGFWTPEYLEEKIEKVRDVSNEKPMVLAVNEDLKCSEDDFEGVEEVFFYDRKIPVKPVVKRINEIEKSSVETDLEGLRKEGLSEETRSELDRITDIENLAEKEGVETDALRGYLRESDEVSGTTTESKYIPPRIADKIRERIDALESKKLAEVKGVLEEYGLGEDALERLGYSVKWTSFSQDDVEVEKKEVGKES